MKYLVVMEVSQKQGYIFQTNRLVEQIGASILIRELTEELPKKFSTEQEFVFAGGGKSVYEFPTDTEAKNFVKNISVSVLRDYPGVEVFLAVQGYEEKQDSVIEAINKLYGNLERKKASRALSFRFYGSGMTEQCAGTQLPAFGKDDRGMFSSRECLLKIEKAKEKQYGAFQRLLPERGAFGKEGYRFANKFSELGGTSGEKDFIAVVVSDGNKMGKKIEKFRKDFAEQHKEDDRESFNREYKRALRVLSEEIDRSFHTSVKVMVEELARNLDELIDKGVLSVEKAEKGRQVLPIRPLIFTL